MTRLTPIRPAGSMNGTTSPYNPTKIDFVIDEQTPTEIFESIARGHGQTVYHTGARIRGAMKIEDVRISWHALCRYREMIPEFDARAAETHSEAQALIKRMSEDECPFVRRRFARAYASMVHELAGRSDKLDELLQSAAGTFVGLYFSPDIDRGALKRIFRRNFKRFAELGLWQASFKGSWVDDIGLSPEATATVRGLANQESFFSSPDHLFTLLDLFVIRSEDKRNALNSILKSIDPTSSESVEQLTHITREFVADERFSKHRKSRPDSLDDVPRNEIENDIPPLDYLKARVGDHGFARLIFADSPPADCSPAQWRNAQNVLGVLQREGLIDIFATSAKFMTAGGRAVIKSVLDDLAQSRVVDGKIEYQLRYDRMVERLRFTPEFAEKVKQDHFVQLDLPDIGKGEEAAKTALLRQTARILRLRADGIQGVKGEFADLPSAIHVLSERLERGRVDEAAVQSLLARFAGDKKGIRATYGYVFHSIERDLMHLMWGLKKGARIGQSEETVEISGGIESMAFFGMRPRHVCQSLTSADFFNERGESYHPLRWGNREVAYYRMDGEIVANHSLEWTMDVKGNEILGAGTLSIAQPFVRQFEFRQEILNYAAGLGVSEERVTFLDLVHKSQVPPLLTTRAKVERGITLKEMSPWMITR